MRVQVPIFGQKAEALWSSGQGGALWIWRTRVRFPTNTNFLLQLLDGIDDNSVWSDTHTGWLDVTHRDVNTLRKEVRGTRVTGTVWISASPLVTSSRQPYRYICLAQLHPSARNPADRLQLLEVSTIPQSRRKVPPPFFFSFRLKQIVEEPRTSHNYHAMKRLLSNICV